MKSYEQVNIESAIKLNRTAIEDFIGELSGIPAGRFIMGQWKITETCGTVACIGGWFDVFYGELNPAMHLGLSDVAWYRLTRMMDDSSYGHSLGYSMHMFDELVSANLRKQCMLAVLHTLLDHGRHSWTIALNETLPEGHRFLVAMEARYEQSSFAHPSTHPIE